MGTARDYSCPQCGYTVDMMVSGYDQGMGSHVAAITCRDCQELYEVELPGKPWDKEAELLAAIIERGEAPAALRCPQSTTHQIAIWQHPGKCPKCGADMEAGDQLVDWD